MQKLQALRFELKFYESWFNSPIILKAWAIAFAVITTQHVSADTNDGLELVSRVNASIDTLPNQEKSAWINNSVLVLKEKVNSHDSVAYCEPVKKSFENSIGLSYRIIDSGVIRCTNGDEIWLIAHSSHKNEAIGDVTIGYVKNKPLFVNEGHVCGGIIHLESQTEHLPSNADDFFNRFFSDTDHIGWKKSDVQP